MGFAKRARDLNWYCSFSSPAYCAGGGFAVDSQPPRSKLGRAQTAADQGWPLLNPLKATVNRSKHESGCRQQPRKCDKF